MKGIMFTGEMVLELLKTVPGVDPPDSFSGPYKTQTRRAIKSQPVWGNGVWRWEFRPGDHGFFSDEKIKEALLVKAKYKPGETVFVKETWWATGNKLAGYAADTARRPEFTKKNAMFMPEAVARVKLEILDVKAVRVCYLNQQEAYAEGFETPEDFWKIWCKLNKVNPKYFSPRIAARYSDKNWHLMISEEKDSGEQPDKAINSLAASRDWCYAYYFKRVM